MENRASTKAPMLTVPTVSSNMQTRTLSHKRLPCDTTDQKPNKLFFYLHIWKMKIGCSNSSQPNWSVPSFQYITIPNFTHTHRHTQRWVNINNLKRIFIQKMFFHTPEHFCACTHTMHARMRTDTHKIDRTQWNRWQTAMWNLKRSANTVQVECHFSGMVLQNN